MAYKVAFLCMLVAAGCCAMGANARTLSSSYPTDGTSCYIYNTCGWHSAPGCTVYTPPTGATTVDLIVKACVNAIVIGHIDAILAVVACIKLLISIDIALCAAVIVALIATVQIGVIVVAQALVHICALVDGLLIVKLIIALGVDVLIKLCVALDVDAAINLLLPLCALIQLNVFAFVQVLAGCCNGLYALNPAWALVIAKVCVRLGVVVVGPLLKLLVKVCLNAVLHACVLLPGGPAFVCACGTLLGINVLGIVTICLG